MLTASSTSYGGMFKVFPWGLGLGGGEGKQNNGGHGQAKPFESSVAQASRINQMKRKRPGSRDSSPSASPLQPPKKKQELAARPAEHANPCLASQTDPHDMLRPTLCKPTPIAPAQSPDPTQQQTAFKRPEHPVQDIRHAVPQNMASNMGNKNLDRGKQTTTTTKKPPTDEEMKDIIEMQFGLEILMKHKELRLIDQEIAKCQIALEQIRRCTIMPYPATSETLTNALDVASGSGPSYGSNAPHASPWGVKEGPYSRHYRRFLIPDAAFGDQLEDSDLYYPDVHHLTDRQSRSSKALPEVGGSKSRTQRGSLRGSGGLQALPHGYPVPKEEKGPMIVKRASDNKMVKLVCLHCRREDFNSAQGFINHCRIAHQQSFASHEAAAAACGQEVDASEVIVTKSEAATPTATTGALVHPLIRTGQLPSSTNVPKRKKQQQPSSASKASRPSLNTNVGPSAPSTPFVPSTSTAVNEASFHPSTETPRLSALISKIGGKGDLAELVTEAKTKPVVVDDSEDDDVVMEDVPDTPREKSGDHPHVAGSRLPARSSQYQPLSRGGGDFDEVSPSSHRVTGSRHPSSGIHPHNLNLAPLTPLDSQITPPSLNLSPQTTESHPAPSLVSDDGDYQTIHSEDEVPSSAHISDEEDLHIHVEDHEHRHSIGDHHHHRHHDVGGSSSAVEVPSAPKVPHRPPVSRPGPTSSRGKKNGAGRKGGK